MLGDAAAIKRLERIVHPLVRARRDAFSGRGRAQRRTVAVLDIPLLFETGGDARCDAVVVVSAPAGRAAHARLRAARHDRGKFAAMLAKQMPDAEKRARADFVVDTSQGFDAARAQVREILKAVAKMPKRPNYDVAG